jgi:caa(3)-type oxidase subunit IV
MAHIHENGSTVIPDPQTDYHDHPNYRKVYFELLALFGLSLVVGFVFSPFLAITLIFATAAWKTALVVKNFMHLKYELLFIWIFVAVVIFCLFVFFFGVYPDITAVHRDVVPQ